MNLLGFIFSILFLLLLTSIKKSLSTHSKEKYFKKNLTINESISEALHKYKECDKNDCFLLQRRSDFKHWVLNGGIKISDFKIGIEQNLGEHYQIINGTIYRQKQCIFPSRCSGNEHFIKIALKSLPPKNIEFIINSHDWPKVSKYSTPSPIFSFSRTENELDILYPAWSFWEGGPALKIYPTGIGRWDIQTEKLIQESEKWPWNEKINIAFFRGSRTSEERDPLIKLSRRKPELVNAKYTKNQAWRSVKDTLGEEPADEVPFEDHCKYKYLFNFRGVAASFRFKHLFLCRSLVFHVGDEWIEFFYGEMKPWVHYIPVSTNLEETEELLNYFSKNDKLANEIANRGYEFIKSRLTMHTVKNYWASLLRRYMKLVKWEAKLEKSFIRV